MEIFRDLQNWYTKHCNGDWEHSYGIEIGTLDNPGWSVKIDLIDTELKDATFNKIQEERSEHDWISCRIEDNKFLGFGGPKNLEEIIKVFLQLASRTIS